MSEDKEKEPNNEVTENSSETPEMDKEIPAKTAEEKVESIVG